MYRQINSSSYKSCAGLLLIALLVLFFFRPLQLVVSREKVLNPVPAVVRVSTALQATHDVFQEVGRAIDDVTARGRIPLPSVALAGAFS